MGIGAPDKRVRMVEILNPISDQMSVLRTSIIPGLLESMARNTAQQVEPFSCLRLVKFFMTNLRVSSLRRLRWLAV